ncbi:MAG TPA: glycosyltransferase family 2 protein [Anaerolineales bacterium]|nr:glycosyltransferase family 2 protein [Anaerolineales bacterium]
MSWQTLGYGPESSRGEVTRELPSDADLMRQALSGANQFSACLSVVVPVYNEAATLSEVVQKVLKIPYLLEIIIVDDCSTDGTCEEARRLAQMHNQIRVVRHGRNTGKTSALKTGFALTTGDVVIVQDADLEYDPTEIFAVIQPILEDRADVVFGSRFLVRRAARVLYFYHYLANKLITNLSNMLTNLNLTDVETGYKAFRGDIIRNMIIVSTGYGFEVEVAAKLAKLKIAIYEVPISYYGRTYDEGKKIGWKDGVAALWLVIRFNLFCSLRASFREIPAAGRQVQSQSLDSYGGELRQESERQ